MKKLKILLILCFLAFSANAQGYKELSKPLANEKNSLIEAFSFACGACYNHHKFGTLTKIKEKLPKLNYKIYPYKKIKFGEEFARLYAYAENQDRLKGLDTSDKNSKAHRLADAYFVAIFERKLSWESSQSFYQLGLQTLNISQNELDSFLESPKGKELYSQYDKATSIVSQYGATPAFCVGGKYIIDMRSVSGLEDLVKLVDELSKN